MTPGVHDPLALLGLTRPRWMRHAVCAGLDTEGFFPEKRQAKAAIADAKAAQCLPWLGHEPPSVRRLLLLAQRADELAGAFVVLPSLTERVPVVAARHFACDPSQPVEQGVHSPGQGVKALPFIR